MQTEHNADSGILILDRHGFIIPDEFRFKEKLSPPPRIETNNPMRQNRIGTQYTDAVDDWSISPPLGSDSLNKVSLGSVVQKYERRRKKKRKPKKDKSIPRKTIDTMPYMSQPHIIPQDYWERDQFWRNKIHELETNHAYLMEQAAEERQYMVNLFERQEHASNELEEECLAVQDELDQTRCYCDRLEDEREALQRTIALREIDYANVETEIQRHRLALRQLEKHHQQTTEIQQNLFDYPNLESLHASGLSSQSTGSRSSRDSALSVSPRDLLHRVRKGVILATSGQLLRTARESSNRRSPRRHIRLTHPCGLNTLVRVCSVKSCLT